MNKKPIVRTKLEERFGRLSLYENEKIVVSKMLLLEEALLKAGISSHLSLDNEKAVLAIRINIADNYEKSISYDGQELVFNDADEESHVLDDILVNVVEDKVCLFFDDDYVVL